MGAEGHRVASPSRPALPGPHGQQPFPGVQALLLVAPNPAEGARRDPCAASGIEVTFGHKDTQFEEL